MRALQINTTLCTLEENKKSNAIAILSVLYTLSAMRINETSVHWHTLSYYKYHTIAKASCQVEQKLFANKVRIWGSEGQVFLAGEAPRGAGYVLADVVRILGPLGFVGHIFQHVGPALAPSWTIFAAFDPLSPHVGPMLRLCSAHIEVVLCHSWWKVTIKKIKRHEKQTVKSVSCAHLVGCLDMFGPMLGAVGPILSLNSCYETVCKGNKFGQIELKIELNWT